MTGTPTKKVANKPAPKIDNKTVRPDLYLAGESGLQEDLKYLVLSLSPPSEINPCGHIQPQNTLPKTTAKIIKKLADKMREKLNSRFANIDCNAPNAQVIS